MKPIALSGNLRLSQDHRGWFILRYDAGNSNHTAQCAFPPHAAHLASQAFYRSGLFLREIKSKPSPAELAQMMIGHQVKTSEPSRAPRAQLTQAQRDRARDNRRRALAKTMAKMAAEGRVPRGTMRAKRDDTSSAPQ